MKTPKSKLNEIVLPEWMRKGRVDLSEVRNALDLPPMTRTEKLIIVERIDAIARLVFEPKCVLSAHVDAMKVDIRAAQLSRKGLLKQGQAPAEEIQPITPPST
jgi:hypothetical protein